MTTIPAAFDKFLEDVVELKDNQLTELNGRVKSIVEALSLDKVLGSQVKDHHPQGSWAHRTIIRPVGQYDEFDADFLLELEPDAACDASPKEYLAAVRAAFLRHPVYKTMVQKKNRCVRIQYANSCHVDVVPYIVRPDGTQQIVNYRENKFEETNPQGFTDWMRERDELAQENLRRVLRLMKYLRDLKNRYTCPSVILTTIVGERVQAVDAETRYADIPTAFTSLMDDLKSWMNSYSSVPPLPDPSCDGDFRHRWDEERYTTFKTETQRYAQWAREAAAETDPAKAVVLWQKLFGPQFVLPPADYTGKRTASGGVSKALVHRAPDEEFPADRGWVDGHDPRYTVRIRASVDMKPGFRAGSLRALRRVNKDRWLTFRAETDVPGEYELWWKVRNHGAEAERVNGLRGKLERDAGFHMKREQTRYAGRHHVEAYVVKNGRVIATGRISVPIE